MSSAAWRMRAALSGAEVFRIYVTRKGKIKELFTDFGRARKDVVLYEKFLLTHRFVRSLRGWR